MFINQTLIFSIGIVFLLTYGLLMGDTMSYYSELCNVRNNVPKLHPPEGQEKIEKKDLTADGRRR
jgi:hypothetical protein